MVVIEKTAAWPYKAKKRGKVTLQKLTAYFQFAVTTLGCKYFV